jgi:hypothetical protein
VLTSDRVRQRLTFVEETYLPRLQDARTDRKTRRYVGRSDTHRAEVHIRYSDISTYVSKSNCLRRNSIFESEGLWGLEMVASVHTDPFYNQVGLNRPGWVGLGLGTLRTQYMVCFSQRSYMNASTNLY